MADPFLDIGQFGGRVRSDVRGPVASATRLLDVVSDYIRLRKTRCRPGRRGTGGLEIVRDSLNFGPYERLSQFDNETSKRKEAGTLRRGGDLAR